MFQLLFFFFFGTGLTLFVVDLAVVLGAALMYVMFITLVIFFFFRSEFDCFQFFFVLPCDSACYLVLIHANLCYLGIPFITSFSWVWYIPILCFLGCLSNFCSFIIPIFFQLGTAFFFSSSSFPINRILLADNFTELFLPISFDYVSSIHSFGFTFPSLMFSFQFSLHSGYCLTLIIPMGALLIIRLTLCTTPIWLDLPQSRPYILYLIFSCPFPTVMCFPVDSPTFGSTIPAYWFQSLLS